MMAKKGCCSSSFFSCLPCFSEKQPGHAASSSSAHTSVNLSKSAPNLGDNIAHASPSREEISDTPLPSAIPKACSEAPFSFSANAANSNVSPAAATEEDEGRRHDLQTPPSASSRPLQASIAHDAASSSSAEGASTFAVPTQDAPASGSPSSSFSTESDVIKNIRKAAAVDEENGNINLEGLIQHISDLLELIKKNELDKKRSTNNYWPKTSGFRKLEEFLSEGEEAASSLKDLIPTARSLLNGIGQLHWAAAGLLVVSNILERFETVSANRNECLCLLDEMYRLAKHVKELKERPRLREGMGDIIQEALEMIVKASTMCCVQIDSSKFSRFFKTTVDNEELLKFQRELENMYKHMKNQFDICLYDAIDCRKVRPRTTLEREYPVYAVGIEEPVKEVTKLLDWESEKNAVAVIVYGFGGVGKSTLADAVFARLYIEGRKYSMVRLFDDITSTPNIAKLQKCILTDLMRGTEEEKKPMPEFTTFEVGQREISRILETEEAFIYIDNVLDGEWLQRLLPRDMQMAKKLRVLITAREMGVRTVCTGCRMEPRYYALTGLPNSEAMNLLKKEMKEGQIQSSQLDQIIKISGGIPILLTMVARFISSEEDKQKAFRIVMEDKEHLEGQAFGDIEHYVFAYDHLPERCKEPFLDICVFFKGMNWDSVADIVGESELDMLEKRALVSKDTHMNITVHDVILKIGIKRSEETRFNSTNATRSETEEFLQKEIPGIRGLWLRGISEIKGLKDHWDIPAIKLDSMSNSLKILRLGNSKVKGECNKRLEKLVFFEGKVPLLPFDISQMPSCLKYMELNGRGHSHVFEISPSDCQRLRNLRILRLGNFDGLKKLPEELGELIQGLRELTLSLCKSIEELPRSISKLQYLRILKMTYCPSLTRLPEDLGSSSSLQELDLSFCEYLKELPESTSKLESLKKLKMTACENLKHLPKDFELLNLQVLELQDCKSLTVLPRNFEKFQNLKPFVETFSLDWLDDDEEDY